ncbi:hypothetical protein CFC21_089592 [Triticum aestivum]|uniref:3-ketoacyl-CoA synthase n=2 Tax=Triticum aestivum TaxID=4565 RepID=A0A3B6PT69_WHEAT|nr:hypothetical protein CFC21_089592 [Triticum aestivum]
MKNILAVIMVVLMATILLKAIVVFSPNKILAWLHTLRPVHLFMATFLSSVTILHYLIHRPRVVYLIDYACFRPSNYRVPISGLGNETYYPPSAWYIPPDHCLRKTRDEAEMVIFTICDELLVKTCLNPDVLDILIVNCSLFNPTPSLADMIMTKFKLRGDIRIAQLSGMGYNAGINGVDLAINILQTMPYGAHALVVSTEILTGRYYMGRKHEILVTNALFRTGGAVVLLSTSRTKARFQLLHITRKSTGAKYNAHRCVFQQEDDEGYLGIHLSKDLLDIAELLSFLFSFITRKLFNARTEVYIPDFGKTFDHFCIHAGGRAVIDGVQRSLDLSNEHVEPSRMTLYRYGNTSSISFWYELAYIEAKGRMRKGDQVLMIGFGSGYKCNSAIWKCIRSIQNVDRAWANCIHRYPIDVFK